MNAHYKLVDRTWNRNHLEPEQRQSVAFFARFASFRHTSQFAWIKRCGKTFGKKWQDFRVIRIYRLKKGLSLSEDEFVASRKIRLGPPKKRTDTPQLHCARSSVVRYSILDRAAWQASVDWSHRPRQTYLLDATNLSSIRTIACPGERLLSLQWPAELCRFLPLNVRIYRNAGVLRQ